MNKARLALALFLICCSFSTRADEILNTALKTHQAQLHSLAQHAASLDEEVRSSRAAIAALRKSKVSLKNCGRPCDASLGLECAPACTELFRSDPYFKKAGAACAAKIRACEPVARDLRVREMTEYLKDGEAEIQEIRDEMAQVKKRIREIGLAIHKSRPSAPASDRTKKTLAIENAPGSKKESAGSAQRAGD